MQHIKTGLNKQTKQFFFQLVATFICRLSIKLNETTYFYFVKLGHIFKFIGIHVRSHSVSCCLDTLDYVLTVGLD